MHAFTPHTNPKYEKYMPNPSPLFSVGAVKKVYFFISKKKSVLTSIATPVKHTPTHKQVPPWCEDENKEYFFVHCSLKGCVCVASSLWDVYSPCALVVWITKTVLMTNKGFGH